MANLILTVGLPYSGKTTRARELETAYGAIRLTPDEWQIRLYGQDWLNDPRHDETHTIIENIMEGLAFSLLAKEQSVILDFGCWAREERLHFRDKCKETNSLFYIAYCHCDEAEMKRRMDLRASSPENSFDIPMEKMREWQSLFQAPKEDEGILI